MKKIAIFQTDLGYGGIQKSLINLLKNIDYNKYKIDLYLFSHDNIYIDDLNKNVNVIYLKRKPYISRLIFFNILNFFHVNKIKETYDVAIDFNSYDASCALNCINVNAKKKIIWVHNDIDIKLKEEFLYRVLHFFFKAKYKKYDEFVGVSKGAIDSFKKYHNYKRKKYYVIPNMIDTKEIKALKDQKITIKIDSNKINLVSVGRLTHQKGFDILLDEFNKVIWKSDNYHLYIVGDGNKKKELENKINELQINEYVTLLGAKKNVYSIMNEMDAFVLTSRYEGQGMVFLEAKALGLDIVMPKHLEKYVEDIKGTDDIEKSIMSIKKHKKEFNDLNDYNSDIINSINKLLGDE